MHAIDGVRVDEIVDGFAFARTLVDDGTEVGAETGLRAAEKLQSVLDRRELQAIGQIGAVAEPSASRRLTM